MAFRQVASLDAEETVALGKMNKETNKPYPKQAEGYYLGNRDVPNARGESKLHFLQTAKGNLGVWGTTDLNNKLAQITVGNMVRITSTGTKPTKNGDMYTYRVEQDDSNTIGVEISASSPAPEDEYNTGYPDVGTGSYDEDDPSDDVGQSQALAAAERKAKVEALLRGGNKGKRN